MYAAHQERPPPIQPPRAMEPHPIERNTNINGNGLVNGNSMVNGAGMVNGNHMVNGNNMTNGHDMVNGNGMVNGNAHLVNGGPNYSTPSSASHELPSQVPQSSPSDTVSCTQNGKIYSLDVVQQPIRARMCGFGDKDRRPITPPPCVRLIIRDATTKQEIDVSELDIAWYVLTVDLWSADGKKEVNLVRHSATSPSISAATASSYPPRPPTPPQYQNGSSAPNSAHPLSMQQQQWGHQQYAPQQSPTHSTHPAQYGYQNGAAAAMYQVYRNPQPLPPPPLPQYQQVQHQYHPHQAYPPQHQQQTYFPQPSPNGMMFYPHQQPAQGPLPTPDQLQPQGGTPASGMFTRNLIGSLTVSAFMLNDPEDKRGIWFVLQDLSVRTEGSFRLRMNFVNVGAPDGGPKLNIEAAPILASTYSDEFQVFSAKKFPGVIESTPLSKCFATQGIKIPIRKDGPRGNVRDRSEFEEDNE